MFNSLRSKVREFEQNFDQKYGGASAGSTAAAGTSNADDVSMTAKKLETVSRDNGGEEQIATRGWNTATLLSTVTEVGAGLRRNIQEYVHEIQREHQEANVSAYGGDFDIGIDGVVALAPIRSERSHEEDSTTRLATVDTVQLKGGTEDSLDDLSDVHLRCVGSTSVEDERFHEASTASEAVPSASCPCEDLSKGTSQVGSDAASCAVAVDHVVESQQALHTDVASLSRNHQQQERAPRECNEVPPEELLPLEEDLKCPYPDTQDSTGLEGVSLVEQESNQQGEMNLLRVNNGITSTLASSTTYIRSEQIEQRREGACRGERHKERFAAPLAPMQQERRPEEAEDSAHGDDLRFHLQREERRSHQLSAHLQEALRELSKAEATIIAMRSANDLNVGSVEKTNHEEQTRLVTSVREAQRMYAVADEQLREERKRNLQRVDALLRKLEISDRAVRESEEARMQMKREEETCRAQLAELESYLKTVLVEKADLQETTSEVQARLKRYADLQVRQVSTISALEAALVDKERELEHMRQGATNIPNDRQSSRMARSTTVGVSILPESLQNFPHGQMFGVPTEEDPHGELLRTTTEPRGSGADFVLGRNLFQMLVHSKSLDSMQPTSR